MHISQYEKFWVAIQVRHKYERLVSGILRHKGYEEFLPTFRRPNNRRLIQRQTQELPLFPGYLFCRFDPSSTATRIVTTPGVIRILGVPGRPSVVPEDQINALRTVIAASLSCCSHPYLEIGERVRIVSGPLAGTTGILTRASSNQRLVIAVDILKRAVSVQVKEEDVLPIQSGNTTSCALSFKVCTVVGH